MLVPQPDAEGRQRIAAIHSKRLRERDCLEPRAAAALGSGAFSEVTEGFSGADIAGLLRSATSFALERYADERLLSGLAPGAEVAKGGRDASSGLLEVRFEDLLRALGSSICAVACHALQPRRPPSPDPLLTLIRS